jgi:hypothetical protein
VKFRKFFRLTSPYEGLVLETPPSNQVLLFYFEKVPEILHIGLVKTRQTTIESLLKDGWFEDTGVKR